LFNLLHQGFAPRLINLLNNPTDKQQNRQSYTLKARDFSS